MEGIISTQPTITAAKQHIIIYGQHDYIVTNITQFVQDTYTSTGFSNLEDTLEFMQKNTFHAIVIGGGVTPHDRIKIQEVLNQQFPQIKMIEHFGGPATILDEIAQALAPQD